MTDETRLGLEPEEAEMEPSDGTPVLDDEPMTLNPQVTHTVTSAGLEGRGAEAQGTQPTHYDYPPVEEGQQAVTLPPVQPRTRSYAVTVNGKTQLVEEPVPPIAVGAQWATAVPSAAAGIQQVAATLATMRDDAPRSEVNQITGLEQYQSALTLGGAPGTLLEPCASLDGALLTVQTTPALAAVLPPGIGYLPGPAAKT